MRIIRLIVGTLLLTAGLPLLLTAGGLWTVGQHRDADGAFRADLEPVDVPGQALLVADLDGLLRRDAAFARAGDTRIRIAAATDEGPAFVGLAPAAEVTTYLRSARHTRVEQIALTRGPLPVRAGTIAGSRTPVADPARQDFWTRSGIGGLTWTAGEIRNRDLALVVMTPNGRPAGTVAITAELRPTWLMAVTWGGLGGGLLLIIGGMIALVWPSRPRELVYVVEPDRLPDVAARLGAHASVIHAANDDDRLVTRITSRPRRRADRSADARSASASADAGSAGALADVRSGDAPADAGSAGAPADTGAGEGSADVRPATLADASRPERGVGPAAPAAVVTHAARAGATEEGGAGAMAGTKARPAARPPVTPQLTWPPLTRDPAGDTKPPIRAGVPCPDVRGRSVVTAVDAASGGASAGPATTMPAAAPVPAGGPAAVPGPATAVEGTAAAGPDEPDTAEIVAAPRKRAKASAAETGKARNPGGAKASAANMAKAPAASAGKTPAKRATNAGSALVRSAAPAGSAPVDVAPVDVAPVDGAPVDGAPVKRQPRRKVPAKVVEPVAADGDAGAGRRGSGGAPAARPAADRDGGAAGGSVAGPGEASAVPVDGALDLAAPAPRAGRRRKAADDEVRPAR
ncbi:hypothetical protein [Catenuloplanes indicus]|uniref:Uncharacterized protein n=1 Tax=Catenuloplanes indicus TaxID=137267 RepID=A0AAE4AYA2_9ACTN|nr:hypothetical protein [Catenuloplanes indicus]MDQ0366541.1 hypothetical protein [Catenuloplanes indicus]